jgi:hypothetical protein
VTSYVMDALETAGPDNKLNSLALRSKAMKLIQSAHLAKIEERKSVALGNDLRLESEQLVGSGLEFDDQIIQLSIFGSGNGNDSIHGSRMRRASTRREFRCG